MPPRATASGSAASHAAPARRGAAAPKASSVGVSVAGGSLQQLSVGSDYTHRHLAAGMSSDFERLMQDTPESGLSAPYSEAATDMYGRAPAHLVSSAGLCAQQAMSQERHRVQPPPRSLSDALDASASSDSAAAELAAARSDSPGGASSGRFSPAAGTPAVPSVPPALRAGSASGSPRLTSPPAITTPVSHPAGMPAASAAPGLLAGASAPMVFPPTSAPSSARAPHAPAESPDAVKMPAELSAASSRADVSEVTGLANPALVVAGLKSEDPWSLLQLSSGLDGICRELKRSVEQEFLFAERVLVQRHQAALDALQMKAEAHAIQQQGRIEALEADKADLTRQLYVQRHRVKGAFSLLSRSRHWLTANAARAHAFTAWRAYAGAVKDDRLSAVLDLRFKAWKLVGFAYGVWRRHAQAAWKERLIAHERQAAELVRAKLLEQLTADRDATAAEVAKLQQKLAAEAKQRQLLQDNLKRVFMKGVCALNVEAMTLFKDSGSCPVVQRADASMVSDSAIAVTAAPTGVLEFDWSQLDDFEAVAATAAAASMSPSSQLPASGVPVLPMAGSASAVPLDEQVAAPSQAASTASLLGSSTTATFGVASAMFGSGSSGSLAAPTLPEVHITAPPGDVQLQAMEQLAASSCLVRASPSSSVEMPRQVPAPAPSPWPLPFVSYRGFPEDDSSRRSFTSSVMQPGPTSPALADTAISSRASSGTRSLGGQLPKGMRWQSAAAQAVTAAG
eukprot:TRINITY_DN9115_c0_g1_i1.p1 TRINITY_DN9115_c0_g1~~TRINITY_DN9115_c0_g1_i1.p1  ORF type:complete len:738 (-),score=141.09 TRINITY_DN9115_c0_g1_i1:268-2481(-)